MARRQARRGVARGQWPSASATIVVSRAQNGKRPRRPMNGRAIAAACYGFLKIGLTSMRVFCALSTFALVDCSIPRVTASTSTLPGMVGAARFTSIEVDESCTTGRFALASTLLSLLSATAVAGVAATTSPFDAAGLELAGATAGERVAAGDACAGFDSAENSGAANSVAGAAASRMNANHAPAPARITRTKATNSPFFDRPRDAVIVGGMRAGARGATAFVRGGVRGRGGAAGRIPRSG